MINNNNNIFNKKKKNLFKNNNLNIYLIYTIYNLKNIYTILLLTNKDVKADLEATRELTISMEIQ